MRALLPWLALIVALILGHWLAGIDGDPRLAVLRAELAALQEAARKNNGGTGQGAYCVSIGMLEQRIREVEAEKVGGDES